MPDLRLISLILSLGLVLTYPGRSDPLTVKSHPSSEVFTKTPDETDYQKRSDNTPYVHQVPAGALVDVLVRSRKNYFQDWVGEAQGLSAPAEVFVEQEPQISWPRTLPVATLALFAGSLAFLSWRRRARSRLEKAEIDIRRSQRRAELARSMTAIPKQLGEFKILDQAGSGAYAVVYRAVDSKGQVYALKVPREDSPRDQREWEVLQKLDSPHIVKAHSRVEASSSGAPAFLVLELLEGLNLSQQVAQSKPTFEEIRLWVDQLLEGLIAAHSQGVIHRDIKPDNLFLDISRTESRLVITDFGVARDESFSRLTKTGLGLGSAAYAPPEQIQGRPLDERADVYAAGVLAFELLTGQLPWTFTDSQDLFRQKEEILDRNAQATAEGFLSGSSTFFSHLLNPDPSLRPGSAKIVKESWNKIWKSSIS